MTSGLIRRIHVEVLRLVALGDISRGDDFDYHIPGRARHVSEAVYLLERVEYVQLEGDGSVTITKEGEKYLDKRLFDRAVAERLPYGLPPSTLQRLII